MQSKETKILKIVMFIVFILIMAFLTTKLFPVFLNISTEEGRMNLKAEIEGLGFDGILIIIGLMVIQIFLPILPGEPVEVLAGMSYGPIGGLIIVSLGAFISTFIIFFAVRKFGRSFIYSFVSKEKIEKIENSKWFKNPKRIYIILFVYVSGLLPIKPAKFFVISIVARFPSIISSTIAGSNLISGNWLVAALTYLITFGIAALIIYVFNKKEKVYIDL